MVKKYTLPVVVPFAVMYMVCALTFVDCTSASGSGENYIFGRKIGTKQSRPIHLTVVVMDLLPSGVATSLSMKTSELVRMGMVNSGAFTVLLKSQTLKVLKDNRIDPSRCADVACAVEAGRVLGANKVITGSIMKMGTNTVINCLVIDIASSKGEFTARETVVSEEEVVGAVDRLVENMIGDMRGESRRSTHRVK